MRVVDEGPAAWYLLERDDGLFLDVHCSHIAAGYSVIIRLTEEELARYTKEGRAFLDGLAQDVQDRGPGSSLQRRDLYRLAYETKRAVEEWRGLQD